MTDPNDKRKAAIKRLEAGRAFKLQAACDDFIAVNLLLIVIWAMTGGGC